MIVTTNIYGVALSIIQLSNNGLLFVAQLLCNFRKPSLQLSIRCLFRQCLRPVKGQVEMAAAVIEFLNFSRGRFIAVQKLVIRLIERFSENSSLGVAGFLCQVFYGTAAHASALNHLRRSHKVRHLPAAAR